jgi:tetratricopeptide (TPR) repeat protein
MARSRLRRLTSLVAGAFTLTAHPASAANDWTSCMTAANSAASIVAHCTVVLRRHDLSPFHRFLLTSARGDALFRLRRSAEAIRDYTQAIALDPVEDETYASRGVAEEDLGQLAQAERDYTEAIWRYRSQPGNRTNSTSDILADDYALRGRTRLRRGQVGAALQDLRQSLRIDPAGSTPALRALIRQAEARRRRS